MRDAMIAYADDTPPPPLLGDSPATEWAFLATGAAFWGTGLGPLLAACLAPETLGRLTGARGVAGFLGMTPLTDGGLTCDAILEVSK
jgi:hypothetical protein